VSRCAGGTRRATARKASTGSWRGHLWQRVTAGITGENSRGRRRPACQGRAEGGTPCRPTNFCARSVKRSSR
jgi:hypothetical protein